MTGGEDGALGEIVDGVRRRRPRAIGRAISIVEAGGPRRDTLMDLIDGTPPPVVGLTGPPGAGKSTLIAALVSAAREAGKRVAVLAVDPSSPFSGGALLGDRLRMTRHSGDTEVFIRSMATRGHGGGLSAAALEATAILGAAGFDTVIVESVGVGQSEVGIMSIADLVLVVLNPGTGDEIQTLKAGVMEIGDVYIINKADLAGADDLERALRHAQLVIPGTEHRAEICRTVAADGTGVPELYAATGDLLARLDEDGALDRRRRVRVTAAWEQLAGDLLRQWLRERGGVPPAGRVRFGELRDRLWALMDEVLGDTGTGGET